MRAQARRGAGALPQSWRRCPFGRRREWSEALFRSAQDRDRRATVARRAAGPAGPANECLHRQAEWHPANRETSCAPAYAATREHYMPFTPFLHGQRCDEETTRILGLALEMS